MKSFDTKLDRVIVKKRIYWSSSSSSNANNNPVLFFSGDFFHRHSRPFPVLWERPCEPTLVSARAERGCFGYCQQLLWNIKSCKLENCSFRKAVGYATCCMHTRAIKRPGAIPREMLQSPVSPTKPTRLTQDADHSIQSGEELWP